jgi:hypothetical protein
MKFNIFSESFQKITLNFTVKYVLFITVAATLIKTLTTKCCVNKLHSELANIHIHFKEENQQQLKA